MPHLYFRNRYWWLASDDLVIPAVYSITGRIFWEFLLIIITYLDFYSLSICDKGIIMLIYLVATIVVQIMMIVNDSCIMYVSLRGTIIDINGDRKSLNLLLYFRLLVTYAEGFIALLGMVGIFINIDHLPCYASKERTMINLIIFGILLLSQLADLGSILCCSYLLSKTMDSSFVGQNSHSRAIGILYNEESILAKWEDRLNRTVKAIQFYGCNRYGGDNINESLRNVARVLTKMFHHDGFLDVVPSDVLAGMILVRLEQFTHRNDAVVMVREQHQMEKNDPFFLRKSNQFISNQKRYIDTTIFRESGSILDQEDTKTISSRKESHHLKTRYNSDTFDMQIFAKTKSRSRSSSNPLIMECTQSFDSPTPFGEYPNVTEEMRHEDMVNMPTKNSKTFVHTKPSAHERPKIALLPTGVLRDIENVGDIVAASNDLQYHHNRDGIVTSACDSDDETLQLTVEHMEHIARYSIYAAAIYTRIVPFYSLGTKVAHVLSNFVTCQFRRPYGVEMCWCCWYGQKITQSTSVQSCHTEMYSRSKSVQVTSNNMSPTVNKDSDQTRLSAPPLEGIDFCGYNRAGLSVFTESIDNNHHIHAVVITIRGTLSVEDGITDITCEPQEMKEAGRRWGFDGRGRYAHSGMLRAAEVMCEEIMEANVLEKVFGRRSYTEKECYSPFTNYQLVITGHSLGAGAAIVLGWILKTKYPNVRCYGFGTPASVLDKRSCHESKLFATTIILGNDIISRLSMRSVMSLRNQVLYSIARARAHKLYILSALLRPIEIEKALYPPGEEPDSEFKQAYLCYVADMEERLKRPENIELYLPGHILHFVKSKIDIGWCGEEASYSVVHGRMEDYLEIPISATMRSDHNPDQYYHELHKALSHFPHDK